MNLKNSQIILFGFLVRLANAFYGGFIGKAIGSDADSYSFHFRAVNKWYDVGSGKYDSIFRNDSFILDGSIFYSKILELIYNIILPHIFVGSLLSCVVWYFSVKILMKVFYILGLTKINQSKILLIYSFLPSSIIFCSITLREPFQLFFVNYLALLFLKIIFLKKDIIKNTFLVFVSCYLLSSLHYSFLFSSIIMLLILTFHYFYEHLKSRIAIFSLIIISVIISINVFNSVFSMMYEHEITEAITRFNEGSSNADTRALYRGVTNISSLTDLFLFIPYSFFQYMLEPLPTRISSIFDLILFFENLFKMFLLLKGLYSLNKYYLFKPQIIIIIYFLIIELIWSSGTTNWGTAARHHIPAFGILSLLAFMLPNNYYNKSVK
jgi:hypothetical protein